MHKYLKAIFILSIGGVLFSGYLSATKIFSGVCAFNESCPYFLGYPACFYGFGFFLVLFISSLLAVMRKIGEHSAIKTIFFTSLLGIIFSASFTGYEASSGRLFGNLGLSTCAYGLFFFIAICVLSCAIKHKDN